MPISDKFILKQLHLSNYYSDHEKITGTVAIEHTGTNTKMEFKLQPSDVAVILDLLADRIAASIRATNQQMQIDTGVLQLEAQGESAQENEKPDIIDVEGSEVENFNTKSVDDDEIPF